jgi:hypothetical protein
MGKSVLTAQYDGCALMERQELKSAGKIMAKSGIDGLRVVFGLQLSFVNANEFLSFSRFLAKTVVSDSVKPGGKTSFAAKAAQIFISLEERLLGEIVRERDIAPDQIPEQTSHTRLMISNQFSESVMVVINNNSRNEVCIG